MGVRAGGPRASVGTRTILAAGLLAASAVQAQDKPVDNGTDPTKQPQKLTTTFEHVALKGGLGSDLLKLDYRLPIGNNSSVGLKLPVTRVTGVGGSERFDLGDASVVLSHVFGLSREGGYVAIGELIGNTAARPELGTGHTVLKATFIAARFLPGGHIFAPAIVQSNSLGGSKARADVNNTTFDFYYVPKLADPHDLVTFDPSLVFDWESNKKYASLAVTYGRVVGKAFGGNAIVTIKPTAFVGGDRPGKWGLELGYKVIGF
ncbi:MAG: hypothetical protein ACK58C_07685 [Betaproteobacteria bacterium]